MENWVHLFFNLLSMAKLPANHNKTFDVRAFGIKCLEWYDTIKLLLSPICSQPFVTIYSLNSILAKCPSTTSWFGANTKCLETNWAKESLNWVTRTMISNHSTYEFDMLAKYSFFPTTNGYANWIEIIAQSVRCTNETIPSIALHICMTSTPCVRRSSFEDFEISIWYLL